MSTNDITGDTLISKTNTKEYNDNYDKIFNKKQPIEIHTIYKGTNEDSSLGHRDSAEPMPYLGSVATECGTTPDS